MANNQQMMNEATKEFAIGANVFGGSVSKFGLTVASLDYVSQKMARSSGSLTDGLNRFSNILNISTHIKAMEEGATNIQTHRLKLAQSYNITGEARKENLKLLQAEEVKTLRFGKSLKDLSAIYGTLSDSLRNTGFMTKENQKGLVATSAMVAQAFSMSNEDSAQMVGNLQLFSGGSGDDFKSFFQEVADSSQLMGVSHKDVLSNIEKSSSGLYRFNIGTEKGLKNFARMSAYTHAMGVDLGQVATNLDKFKTVGSALETASELLAVTGVRVDYLQLFASAQLRAKDPLYLMKTLHKDFQKRGFRGDKVDRNAYNTLAPMFADKLGVSVDEFIKTAKYMRKHDMDINRMSFKDIEQMAIDNRGIFERIDAMIKKMANVFIVPMMELFLPAIEKLVGVIEKIHNYITGVMGGSKTMTNLTKAISGMAFVGLLLVKAMFDFKMIATALKIIFPILIPLLKKLSLGALFHKINSRGAKGTFEDIRNKFSGGKSGDNLPASMSKEGFARQATPRQILSQGAAMIMFAGAVWILSQAFREFGKVSGAGFKQGILAMVVFTIALVALSYVLTSQWGVLLATSGLLLAFAGSIWVLSKSMQNFVDVFKDIANLDVGKFGDGLWALAKGFGAFSAIMTVGGIFGGMANDIGFAAFLFKIGGIGKVAEKYGAHIAVLGNAMMVLAEAMERISAVAIATQGIDLQSGILGEISGSIIANGGSAGKDVPVHTNIRLDVEGRRLASATVDSVGTPYGGSND